MPAATDADIHAMVGHFEMLRKNQCHQTEPWEVHGMTGLTLISEASSLLKKPHSGRGAPIRGVGRA
jgi:hypothetical protein